METKLSKVAAAYRAGDHREAIRLAAKFPQLGAHKEPITRAWAAIQSPDFYESIGQDPAALVAAGVAALAERYSFDPPALAVATPGAAVLA
jgi:aspartate/methionine/tyrosine aminotransferase